MADNHRRCGKTDAGDLRGADPGGFEGDIATQASLWIPDGKSILMTVYLSAITPACATVTSMAQLYDRDASHSSAIYVLSTLLSILTMPLMIGLFELLL